MVSLLAHPVCYAAVCYVMLRMNMTCNNCSAKRLPTLPASIAESVYVTVRCPSVRLSVRLTVPSIDSSSDVRLVCRRSLSGQRQCRDPRRIDVVLFVERLLCSN